MDFLRSLTGNGQQLQISRHPLTLATGRGPMSLVSYQTEGLRRFGQRELILTLPEAVARKQEADVQSLLETLGECAREGRLVDEMGISVVGGPFGHQELGIGYLPVQPIEGLQANPEALSMLLFVGPEVELLQRTGPYRLATRLGYEENFYPWPAWSNPTRQPVYSQEDIERGVACKATPIWLPRAAWVYRAPSSHLVLHLTTPLEDPDRLGSLPVDLPFTLVTRPAAEAGARMVWLPGAPRPAAITDGHSDGSTLTGGVLIVCPGQSQEEVRPLEDGYVLLLSTDHSLEVRNALIEGSPLSFVAGETRVTVARLGARARISLSVLYQPDEVLQQRVRPDWVSYAMAVSEEVNAFVEPHPLTGPLSVYAAIKPGRRARFWFEGLPETLRSGLDTWLSDIPAPMVMGAVAFSHHFLLGETEGPAPDTSPFLDQGGGPFHFLPREWSRLGLEAERPLMVPDEILELLWPD
ncbi:MAG: hypothetical protein AB1758_12795 [Candidatus Eremiobacterota bacterium]